MWVNGKCSLRTHGADGDLSERYGVEDCFDDDLFTTAAMETGELSTVLRADLVRSRELTLAVDKVLYSPKSWSLMVENESPGKLSSKKTARSLSLIFSSGSVAVACASWV